MPEKFFSPNSRVTIGKKIKLKDMKTIGIEPITQKKTPIINKRMSLYRKSLNFINNNINNNENYSRTSLAYNHISNKEKQQISNEKYDIIDNEQLKKIFNKFKTFQVNSSNNRNKFNKENENYKYNKINNKKSRNKDKNFPLEITESLAFQNNKMKLRQKLNNKIKNISKYISTSIKKKENDLLLNRVDDYSFKKELLNEIDFNKTNDEKYGIYKWNVSLRRPRNFEGKRNAYINLTREQNPFWGIVVEKCPKIKELKMRPGILYKNKSFLEKFKKGYYPLINLKDIKILENLDTLTVKGKNLYNIEYNREINNNKGKKKLYKVIVDKGGKIILKTEINNIFGETTFFENYNNNNLLSINRTNFTNPYNTFTSKILFQNKSNANFKNYPNSSINNDEIYKKSTFFKSKSSIDI